MLTTDLEFLLLMKVIGVLRKGSFLRIAFEDGLSYSMVVNCMS